MMSHVKRASVPAVLLAATLALAGCSGTGLQEGAVIDGTSYSVEEVQEAAAQINSIAAQPGDVRSVIYEAAIAPVFADAFAGSPFEVSDAELRTTLRDAGLQDEATDLTLESARFRQYATILQSPDAAADPQMQPVIAQLQGITQEDVNALDVQVNPRFGAWDPANGGVVPQVPEWIAQPGTD